ncbi:MAG: PBP1A family penicillin-binding protein [Actinomycetota bacterium]|nr:PBP1A family penicillin-binding protein [Actinomycetota bacterium]
MRRRARSAGWARCVGISMALLLATAACSLRPVDLAAERPLAVRSTIRAADGSFLVRLGGTNVKNQYCENRALASFEEIPQVLVDAVLAAEDARFFEHKGFDIKAIARAALVNLDEGEVVQGGSTITQQFVKNTYFKDPGKTLNRKARELRLAIEVERLFSKEEILERYLNTVYLGNGAYGIKAAAETYFRAPVSQLSIEQAALLAALIKAPSLYDPREHPRRATSRRDYVLRRMRELELIDKGEHISARRAPLLVIPDLPRVATRQPYFVEAVKREILADRRLGPSEAARARELCKGGLRIETTLVPEIQRAAENAVSRILDRRGDPAAALVAIRPRTGEIVAMVGGRDWETSQVNLALGRAGGGSGRQPGSAFKPIVAAAALEQGIGLETRYESAPTVLRFPNSEPYPVRNAEGRGYGLLPIGEAMVHSVNGVFARLALDVGLGRVVTQAKLMGVRSKIPPLPSIALGAAEVSVLDMATAYATLANYGTAVEPTTIREIRLGDGAVFHPDQEVAPETVSPGNAYLLTKVLQQVVKRGTGTAADFGRPAAGKTGTTNNYTDAWFVGYTPELVAAVWVGYPQGTIPMTSVHGIRVFGGTFPAQIWRLFMAKALEGQPVERFHVPRSDLVTVTIDTITGLLAAPWCPGKPQTMLRQLAPTEVCPVPPPPPIRSPEPSRSPSAEPSRSPKTSPSPSGSKDASPSPSGDPSPSPSPSRSR